MANYDEQFDTDNGGWQYARSSGLLYPATWSTEDGGCIRNNAIGKRFFKSITGSFQPGSIVLYRVTSVSDYCGQYRAYLRISDGINSERKRLYDSWSFYEGSFVLSNNYTNPTIHIESENWRFQAFGLSFIMLTGVPGLESTVLGIGRKQRGAYVTGGVSCGSRKRNIK